MTEPVREKLENLRTQTQADSLTEVIRRALAIYDYLQAEKVKGNQIVVRSPQGEKEVVIL